MNTKKLKQLVLDLAIHGKLVPQDPNDEPASELLKRIKENVETHGRACKSKKSAISSEDLDEVPFEVPEGWCWTTIKDICTKIGSGSTPRGSNYSEEGIPFFRSQNVYNDGLVYDDIKFISEETHQSMIGTEVHAEDLLLNITGGSLGRCAVVPSSFLRGNVSQHVCILRTMIDSNFLHAIILSDYFSSTMILSGSGREGLPKYSLEAMYIPLPPLSEQRRIVAETERWFGVIDQLESNEADLKKSIEQTKKKVLDLAIRGKLVKQEAGDEPASELLARIKENVETHGRASKGKKTVSQDIDLDEVPFELPKGWEWCRGYDIFFSMTSIKPSGKTFKYIDIESIDNKRNIIISPKIINVLDAPSRASRKTEVGDVLFSMVRPYLRNIAKVTETDCIASTGFYVCKPNDSLNSDYCFYLMISDYVVDGLNSFMKGDNSPSISNDNVNNWLFPLPPLAEQKRIVSKIEDVFGVLDRIGEMVG